VKHRVPPDVEGDDEDEDDACDENNFEDQGGRPKRNGHSKLPLTGFSESRGKRGVEAIAIF
jgi:hypothetical protein